jgi:hypothetical protein
MYLEDFNMNTGERHEKPKIHWEEEEKYAIIAFLLLSLDKKTDQAGKVRFDDFFGLNEPPEEAEEETPFFGYKATREAGAAVIRECEKFLDGLVPGERYDAIVDEIDRFIQGEDGRFSQCNIGASYNTWGIWGIMGNRTLNGGAYRLWDLVKLVIDDSDYAGNKKRLLKHLVRKWNIEPSVLPILESAARIIPEIAKNRKDLSESDMPYREVISRLAELDAEENAVWKQLKSNGIAPDRETSAYVAQQLELVNSVRAIKGEAPIRPDINELEAMADEDQDEEDDEEEDMGDKITDSICKGIGIVGDIICAPFNFLTEKISGL